MTDIVISCDAVVRLSSVTASPGGDVHPEFSTIRIDGGQAVATDRCFMAVENIGGDHPIFNLVCDPALITQCRTEAMFNGSLTITVNEMLKFAVGKTTLGYVTASNIGFWGDTSSDFDRWREIVAKAGEPLPNSHGGMFWEVDGIAKLSKSSPSGMVAFAENIHADAPTLLRDVTTHDWLGVFQPYSSKHNYGPATLPSWAKS